MEVWKNCWTKSGIKYQVMKRKKLKREKIGLFLCKNISKCNQIFSWIFSFRYKLLLPFILRYRRVTCTFYPPAGLGRWTHWGHRSWDWRNSRRCTTSRRWSTAGWRRCRWGTRSCLSCRWVGTCGTPWLRKMWRNETDPNLIKYLTSISNATLFLNFFVKGFSLKN